MLRAPARPHDIKAFTPSSLPSRCVRSLSPLPLPLRRGKRKQQTILCACARVSLAAAPSLFRDPRTCSSSPLSLCAAVALCACLSSSGPRLLLLFSLSGSGGGGDRRAADDNHSVAQAQLSTQDFIHLFCTLDAPKTDNDVWRGSCTHRRARRAGEVFAPLLCFARQQKNESKRVDILW